MVPQTEVRSFTIDNLQPDTSYTISVTTESGMVGSLTESTPREIVQTTSRFRSNEKKQNMKQAVSQAGCLHLKICQAVVKL